MGFLDGFRTEILRPVLLLLVPGVVVASPAVFVLGHYHPDLFVFADNHPTLSTLLGFVASAALGMVTHDLGTHIEVDLIDSRLKTADPAFEEDWYGYLRCAFPERSVAQSYIHANVLNLKFELGMAAALALAIVFSGWLWIVLDDTSLVWFGSLLFCLLAGAAFFFYEATQTAAMLARVRKELLKGIGLPPNCR